MVWTGSGAVKDITSPRVPCITGDWVRAAISHEAKKTPGLPGVLRSCAGEDYSAGRMFAACLPFGPVVTSKVTFWFSARVLKPLP